MQSRDRRDARTGRPPSGRCATDRSRMSIPAPRDRKMARQMSAVAAGGAAAVRCSACSVSSAAPSLYRVDAALPVVAPPCQFSRAVRTLRSRARTQTTAGSVKREGGAPHTLRSAHSARSTVQHTAPLKSFGFGFGPAGVCASPSQPGSLKYGCSTNTSACRLSSTCRTRQGPEALL